MDYKWKSCEIPLGDNWYILSDPYQWICIKRKKIKSGKNAGEWKWDWNSATYYREVLQLLDEWGKKLVRMGGYKTVQGMVTYARDIKGVLESIARQTALIEEVKSEKILKK